MPRSCPEPQDRETQSAMEAQGWPVLCNLASSRRQDLVIRLEGEVLDLEVRVFAMERQAHYLVELWPKIQHIAVDNSWAIWEKQQPINVDC